MINYLFYPRTRTDVIKLQINTVAPWCVAFLLMASGVVSTALASDGGMVDPGTQTEFLEEHQWLEPDVIDDAGVAEIRLVGDEADQKEAVAERGDATELDGPLDEVVLEPELRVEALEEDGPRYRITKLILIHEPEHPELPSVEELGHAKVDLVLTETGYAASRLGVPSVLVALSDIDNETGMLRDTWFHASALRKIAQTVVEDMNRRGYVGVFVAPHADDIEEGEDLRARDDTSLRLVIRTVVVATVRTLGAGDRIPEDDRINNPIHDRIRERSPVQPTQEGQVQRRDLLRRDLLDDFVFRLNRHPGRRVDVAVSRSGEAGGIILDYLITENSPVLAYFQVSNTGTEQTAKWRERFGIVNNQFTGNDDVLSIDYVTAGFDKSHSVVTSYEAPFFDDENMRWRVFGSWGEFTASDVGVSQQVFLGNNWSIGTEMITNIYQHRELFIDFVAGARFESIFVDNRGALQKGKDKFFLPYLGINIERIVEVASTLISVSVERNIPKIGNTEVREIINFGRTNPEDRWTTLKWNVDQAFYLEPLLDRKKWEDVATPDTSTLAHEIALNFKGQHAFGSRLIPQMEMVAGGLYSVRGYEESATAGDTVFIGSFEYRYHIPRAFALQPNPSNTPLFGKPFRFAPQQVYGRPDWDLIFRAFFDAAYVIKSDRIIGLEKDERLLGTGFGFELQFQRNVNIRLDWGFALEDAGDVQAGSEQIHIVATFLF